MSPKLPLVTLFLAVLLFAASCGSDDVTDVDTAAQGEAQAQTQAEGGGDATAPVATSAPVVTIAPADTTTAPVATNAPADTSDTTDAADTDDTADDPIPVEPDGGIGDGAEPLPGAGEPADEGTWHGAEVAVTNCPGMEWKRVQASAFSFSIPANFVESDVQPIDSEVGIWTGGDKIEVSFDYGWYSGSIGGLAGAENEPVDYSGIVGERTIVRDGDTNMVGVLFEQVAEIDGQWDRLSMLVRFPDANDEIIGRCIVGSIAWG